MNASTRDRASDQLYIDNVMMLPRGDCAVWVGKDFPVPHLVNMRDCHIVYDLGIGASTFWRRRRLRSARPYVARMRMLREVWAWTASGNRLTKGFVLNGRSASRV